MNSTHSFAVWVDFYARTRVKSEKISGVLLFRVVRRMFPTFFTSRVTNLHVVYMFWGSTLQTAAKISPTPKKKNKAKWRENISREKNLPFLLLNNCKQNPRSSSVWLISCFVSGIQRLTTWTLSHVQYLMPPFDQSCARALAKLSDTNARRFVFQFIHTCPHAYICTQRNTHTS